MSETLPLPERPNLVLRVGFAGNRDLPPDAKLLDRSLDAVLTVISNCLVDILSQTGRYATQHKKTKVVQYYVQCRPTIRLVTGLAEGADALAAQALERVDASKVHPELGGIVPFEVEKYRASRREEFLPTFDRIIERCSYVLELDGCSDMSDASKLYRGRAYRALSTMLLRHSDLLIVIVDPDREGRAGGTLETIRSALEFDLPVVYINSDTGKIRVLEPATDLHSALAGDGNDATDQSWEEQLCTYIADIVADPDLEPEPDHAKGHDGVFKTYRGEQILEELFSKDRILEKVDYTEAGPKHKKTRREKLWVWLEKKFQDKNTGTSANDIPYKPYLPYLNLAKELNYYYTGLYRGTFFLNYMLAIVAVTLAALTLVVIGKSHTSAADQYKPYLSAIRSTALQNGPAQTEHSKPAHDGLEKKPAENNAANIEISSGTHGPESHSPLPPPLIWLLTLGGLKLAVVYCIYRNTREANRSEWNYKAVDYRYLVERLRTMQYLPRIGSFQPPVANPLQFASRVIRQSSVDWLFDAIIRSSSPAKAAEPRQIQLGNGKAININLIQLDVRRILNDIQDKWLMGQIRYHDRNSRTLGRLHAFLEHCGKKISFAVMIVVMVDIVFLLADFFQFLPDDWSHLFHSTAPFLVFMATVLPAVVASLNGINFQSECSRLAERSAVMRVILGGKPNSSEAGGRLQDVKTLNHRIEMATETRAKNPHAWSVEVLNLGEKIATDLVQEVAEWSVLYAKEVVES